MAQTVVPEAAVAVIDKSLFCVPRLSVFAQFLCLLFCSNQYAFAAVIAEDRADALFHAYSGGGITISGPSVLIRKGYDEKVSAYLNLYQDNISGASIDILVSGSTQHSEDRSEYSFGVDYLHDKTMLSIGAGNSTEDDHIADSVHVGVSQDFFGDMTTLSMGYTYGEDNIKSNLDPNLNEFAQRKKFSLGLTQVLTKKWIVSLSLESIVDAGYLQNPYRVYHYIDNSTGDTLRGKEKEKYPETHNSDALAIRSMYYLPNRAAVKFEARIYDDSWGITAKNFELRYIHPVRDNITLEIRGRTYSQTQADFYSDLFNYKDEYEFLGRDKELSTFKDLTFGVGATYELDHRFSFAKKESVSLFWDFIAFDYDNFRDACESEGNDACGAPPANVGEESAYSFQANVLRLFFSVYF